MKSSEVTLEQCIERYKQTYYTDDEGSIAIMFAIIIGSWTKLKPIWLYLIGATSGGKSTLIEAFEKVPGVHGISDLTPNTFLSGAKNSTKETSLLKRLGNNFTVTMKDFTTIMEKSDDAQSAIIAQMREIYDGAITKETGNGETISWGVPVKGKATFIMASTEAVYILQDKFADMGTRAINYVLKDQDRKSFTKRALRNNTREQRDMEEIQELFKAFVEQEIRKLPAELPYVSEEIEDNLIEIAEFTSRCRSSVRRDYRGAKNLALSAEMPARMAKQLLGAVQLLIQIGGEKYIGDVYKCGFDSIIKQRRLALETLAKHARVTRSGMADSINYPPERCEEWIEDLHMFGIVYRISRSGRQFWALKAEYKELICKYLDIVPDEGDLVGKTGDEFDESAQQLTGNYDHYSWEAKEELQEAEKRVEQDFEEF